MYGICNRVVQHLHTKVVYFNSQIARHASLYMRDVRSADHGELVSTKAIHDLRFYRILFTNHIHYIAHLVVFGLEYAEYIQWY